mmetsp:Transcript_18734/g.40586  ORF Transcript_18734/g.40586 Transcript_18734/m.40586 type:complete len:489 (+) Transcript_18734:114-1580(+)|eukprot:CAMPEP_0172314934 /NCGR_PEP_ID=MMETSP1058-20130122/23576_1 /TAXON_ID=83371 /ORGANISM="Detonula confervacea, Strain CCMP 353" /LENGTH=488 /DNA_ID=CAMNT_0013028891 /DNA_START=36 /DNA_END=1502 /DNA_ORIENTATION=+
MPRKNTKKTSNGGYTPPPPIAEQKRQRRKDPSITPSPPYLLTSQFLDFTCSLPILKNACPAADDGGWRSAFPPDLVTFPTGKLSHSFRTDYVGDIDKDVTFEEYMHNTSGTANSVVGSSSNTISATLYNYYDFAFQTNSTTLCDLTHPLALCVLLVLVLMVRTVKKTCLPKFSSLGRRLGRAAHGPTWENDNADRIYKFGEYVYRLCYHSAVSIYGVWYFHKKSWWDNSQGGTKNMWINHPNQPVEPGMTWYYLVQSAYNVDALLSLLELSFTVELVNPFAYSSALDFLEKEHVVDEEQRKQQVLKMMAKSRSQTLLWTPLFQIKWSPTVRGDFREMMAHHLVTNGLIFLSSYYRLTRSGSMIFLLHDLSDVPIDMSKLANFVKWKVTTIVCFVGMVLMWIITRLGIFPFVILRGIVTECYEYFVLKGPMDPALHDAYYLLFYFGLGALLLLHVTWFLILLRIGWTLVSTGERHDYTEHKKGEKHKDS